ncbi:MAG: DUF4340 domain-containing protein [Betaproteobacteria bacterium]|nr:DUF4340 domain-containing protein [Betaproteobacteria bacterium]
MSRKQFLILLVALVVLAVAGAGVFFKDRSAWKRDDARLGEKLLPALKAAEVSEIVLRGERSEVHVVKSAAGWIVRERADFPADANAVSGLLLKLIDLKVVQTEPSGDAQRARLLLLEPKPPDAAAKAPDRTAKVLVPADGRGEGAKAEAGRADSAGTVLELKDGAGKVLGRLLLGKTLMKQSDQSGDSDIPSGRYVLVGDGAGSIVVVADPLKDADPGPAAWLDKDVIRADSVKSVKAVGPDGRQRWSLSRAKEGDLMTFVSSPDKVDPQKGQDTVSAFYGISLLDVVADPARAGTGLDKPLTVTAQSFDGVSYVLKIGAKAGDDRYYLAVSSAGQHAKTREPVKGESAEDKAKRDKEFEESLPKRAERRARDKTMEKWAYIVPRTAIAAVMRERTELFPDKKPEAKKP